MIASKVELTIFAKRKISRRANVVTSSPLWADDPGAATNHVPEPQFKTKDSTMSR